VILAERAFRKFFRQLEGDRLTRPPKGFRSDHPAVDLLRYKQFLVSATYSPALAESRELFSEISRHFQSMMPLVRFLNSPLIKQNLAVQPQLP
jgi:uncharacterized protein (DUF2461 family)